MNQYITVILLVIVKVVLHNNSPPPFLSVSLSSPSLGYDLFQREVQVNLFYIFLFNILFYSFLYEYYLAVE